MTSQWFYQTGRDIPIDWETVDNALVYWFSEATGLKTIWREQNAPQPAYPFAGLLRISGSTPWGPQDEQRYSTTAGEPAGQEVTIETVNMNEFTLSCQIFDTKENAHCNPNQSPSALMTIAQKSLSKVSWLDYFKSKGLAVQRPESVVNISEVVDSRYLAQSGMDVIFMVASNVEERTGYVKTVGIRSTVLGIDDDFGG